MVIYFQVMVWLLKKLLYELAITKKFSKGIIEVDTVHYIDLSIALFGNILDYKILANKIATSKSRYNNDTISLLLKTKKIPFYIFSSYSSAFFFKLIIFGTNGIIEYDGNKITLKVPEILLIKLEDLYLQKLN